MKIAILEFDTRLDNKNINKMLEMNEKYCKINNYSFIFDNLKINDKHYEFENFLSNENDLFNIRLYFHRFEMFEKYINDFDYLVSFDSDVIVNNPNIKIEDLIDNEYDFFVCQDSQMMAITAHLINSAIIINEHCKKENSSFIQNPYEFLQSIKIFDRSIYKALNCIVTNPNGYNFGFIIIKCSNIIKDFINDFKKYYVLFSNCFYDQGCGGFLLNQEKYKKILKVLPITTQGNPFLSSIFQYDEDKNFLCHFYGHNSKDTEIQKILDKIEHNKWWNQIK